MIVLNQNMHDQSTIPSPTSTFPPPQKKKKTRLTTCHLKGKPCVFEGGSKIGTVFWFLRMWSLMAQ